MKFEHSIMYAKLEKNSFSDFHVRVSFMYNILVNCRKSFKLSISGEKEMSPQ